MKEGSAGSPQLPCGGMHIVLGGDFGQLKPVDGQNLTNNRDLFAPFRCVEFTQVVRRKDPSFARCLENFINKEYTEEDIRLIT